MERDDATGAASGRLPGFGPLPDHLGWDAGTTDRRIAQDVLLEFHDRRVLYSPHNLEDPSAVYRSVQEIRAFLKAKARESAADSELRSKLLALLASCRKYLAQLAAAGITERNLAALGTGQEDIFKSGLGEMRGVFGVHIAQMSVMYKLPVEADLAPIMPAEPTEDDLRAEEA